MDQLFEQVVYSLVAPLYKSMSIRVPQFAHICELNAADWGLFVAI